MNSKTLYKILFVSLFSLLVACSDAENETNLLDLYAVASLDIMSIEILVDSTETILSVNSQFDFQLQGLKSNGNDLVTITNFAEWSLSEGAVSQIDQTGHFTAGDIAEIVTVTAKVGHLSQSIQISVSSAKFDKVVQLNNQAISIDMCQSEIIKPIGRYVDENGNEEIRAIDSIVINTIEWLIYDQGDTNISKRAYIDTSNNQATLHTLAAGNFIIQAKAMSLYSGAEETSDDFSQNISNALNSIKLCNETDTDLSNCAVTSARVEKDKTLSLMAVGNYQAADGTSFNENISHNSKWGVSDITNASTALSTDYQYLGITGEIEDTSVTVSVACGDIGESLDSVDISQGVVLTSPVNCSSDINCLASSALISIDKLSVTSFDVSANDIDLVDNESLTLSERPDEISLLVTANYSNDTNEDISEDESVIFSIISIDGQSEVIEEKSDTSNIFTVLGSGTAKIQIDFRSETFIVLIVVP